MKKIAFILLTLLEFLPSFAQNEDISTYPQDYFQPPVKIPLLLAGNFGECRPGHFHSGIDIKTNGKENQPVYATADGYISRIKMEKGGFGHALYISHPEGFTTLYAHLNDFSLALQKYLRKMQYEKESWAMDLSLSPGQFPVKQGEQIAWSGNTGSSTAPHLHFEIRDSKTEHPLNPQLFGFDIKDDVAPVPLKVAVYTKATSTSFYDLKPQIFPLKKKKDVYTTSEEVLQIQKLAESNELLFGFELNDYMNESTNTLTFYTAELYVDEQLCGRIRLDDIGYDVTRYINAYVDYPTKFSDGIWLQGFFQLPGNEIKHIYEKMKTLVINDEDLHSAKMIFKDAVGNESEVNFKFQLIPIKDVGFSTKGRLEVSPSSGLTWSEKNINLMIPPGAVYDNVSLRTGAYQPDNTEYLSPRCTILEPQIPAHTRFELKIKPDKPIPFAQRSKIVMMYSNGKEETGEAATQADKGWYQVKTRSFGEYWLIADTVAPVITALQKNNAVLTKADRISFRVKENLTSVKTFRAELDGKWICFEPRGDIFFYEMDEHCPKGKHTLVIKASDENDNTNRLKFSFTR